MSFDRSLTLGIDAYNRGSYQEASNLWSGVKGVHEPRELALLEGLIALSAGLAHLHSEEPNEAAEQLVNCRAAIVDLPARVLGVDVSLLRAACDLDLETLAKQSPRLCEAKTLPPGTLRFAGFLAILVGSALIFRFTSLNTYLNREVAIQALETVRGAAWAPFALIGSFAVLAPLGLPISPLIMAGGVVFGAGKGALFNYIGSLMGGALSYWLARFLGRDFVVQIAGSKLRRVEVEIARHGFWSLAGIRLMPIPFPVANFGMALAGVPFPTFMASTAIGLTPGILMYTYLATVLAAVAEGGDKKQALSVGIMVVLFTLIGSIPTLTKIRRRRRRYRSIREERRRTRSKHPNGTP